MRAQAGDMLVTGADRVGVVIGAAVRDGSPPYIVRWLADGHICMVTPDPYARIVPAGSAAAGDRPEEGA